MCSGRRGPSTENGTERPRKSSGEWRGRGKKRGKERKEKTEKIVGEGGPDNRKSESTIQGKL